MADPNTEALEKIRRYTDDMLADLSAMLGPGLDSLKSRAAYYEKLVVLNGGTLALSFSAAATVHNKGVSNPAAAADMLAAWKCLIFSIAAALLAHWLSISNGINMFKQVTGTLLHLRYVRAAGLIRVGNPAEAPPTTVPNDSMPEKAGKALRIGEGIGNVLALASQGVTVAGFVWLYKFGKAGLF